MPASPLAPAPVSMGSTPRWHWLVLLVVLPLVVTMAAPDWVFSSTDFIDAWVYNGFFRHLEQYASAMFPQTYYGSRLGWIVPGYVAYHLFAPVAAAFVLHLSVYCTAVASLYVILRRVAGPSGALFLTCAYGLYLQTVRTLGSDYVDAPVITYALAAVALGLAGVERSRVWLTFASGVMVGAMLNSNIGAVFLFPSILVWFVPARLERRLWKPLTVQAAAWCLGIVACTAALVGVSLFAGGEWDFFMDSIRWMRSQRGVNPWDVKGLAWVATAPWVFLPAATLVATGLFIARRRSRAQITAYHVRAVCALALCSLVFLLWDFVGSGALLYWPFYASWLAPWSFIVLGVLMARAPESRADLATLALAGSVWALSLAWPRSPFALGFWSLTTTVALAVLVATTTAVVRRGALACALVFLNGWFASTNFYRPTSDRADAFRAIDRGVNLIDRHLTGLQPRFLLTSSSRLGHYVQGLTSVYLWGYTIVSDNYPTVTEAQAARIEPGAIVIVIAEQAAAAATFNNVLAPYGLVGRQQGTGVIDTVHGSLYLTFFEVNARPAS